MGKVGSTTVINSLLSVLPPTRPVHQCHWLVEENLQHFEGRVLTNAKQYKGTPLESNDRPYYVWSGQFYTNKIKRLPPSGRKWELISLVRDPVARNMSYFFQGIETTFAYDLKTALKTKPQLAILEDLSELFYRAYLSDGTGALKDNDPTSWFDVELKHALDIDVYEVTFPAQKGFSIIENSHVKLLLLRMEDLNRCAEQAFYEFLGLENFSLKKGNYGEDKYYAMIYKSFLDYIKIPEEYFLKLYESKFCRHFYLESEIANFKKYWQKNMVIASQDHFAEAV